MLIKRIQFEESAKDQRNNLVEVVKSGKEVIENLITGTMVSKAMGTLKKDDICLLYIIYKDVEKDLKLDELYGSSGPISEFISEGKKLLSGNKSNAQIKSIELVVEKPFNLKSATCHFDGDDKDIEFTDFSKPFGRIVYRLK